MTDAWSLNHKVISFVNNNVFCTVFNLVHNRSISKCLIKIRVWSKFLVHESPGLKFSHLNLPDIIQGSKTNIKFISTFTFKLSSYSSYMLQVQITEMTLTSPWQWLEALKLTEKGERVFVSLLISSSSININWLSWQLRVILDIHSDVIMQVRGTQKDWGRKKWKIILRI